MKFFETSKYFSLKKSTYINLRWIAIIGQLITVNLIYFVFDFRFNLILENSIILIGALSNLYLIYINKNTQLSDKIAFLFLSIDILQLSCLIYLTGGIINPFSIFLIIPAIFSSSNLGFRSNLLLVSLTVLVIIFLTFFNKKEIITKPIKSNVVNIKLNGKVIKTSLENQFIIIETAYNPSSKTQEIIKIDNKNGNEISRIILNF